MQRWVGRNGRIGGGEGALRTRAQRFFTAGAAVLALSLPAGAWAGPQALAAGAPEEAGCSWGIKSNPDTVNIAYPDLDVTYWAHEFVPVPGERLVIKGAYPAARYFSFHVYDSRAFPLDSAFDARIAPDPGSSNPFLAAVTRHPRSAAHADAVVRSRSESELLPGQR